MLRPIVLLSFDPPTPGTFLHCVLDLPSHLVDPMSDRSYVFLLQRKDIEDLIEGCRRIFNRPHHFVGHSLHKTLLACSHARVV